MIHRDHIDDRYGDVLEEQSPPAVKRVISALDLLSTLPAAPHARQLDAAMTRLMTRQTAARPPRRLAPARRRHAQARTLLCVAFLAAALLLALDGLAGYPRLESPTPVSARGVLFRATAALRQTMPNTVIHDRGTLFFPRTGAASIAGSAIIETPVTATVDQWTQLDAAGGIGRRMTTYTGRGGALLARVFLAGSVARVLGVQHTDGPAIYTVETFARPYGERALTLADPLGQPYGLGRSDTGSDLQRLVADAAGGAAADAHLLPARPLDGARVYAVDIRPPRLHVGDPQFDDDREHEVLYIDARTYEVRGDDRYDTKGMLSSSLRLSPRETRAPAGIPPRAFALDAPTGARVLPPTSEHDAVARAVALASPASLLLSGDPDGLRLRDIICSRGPGLANAYLEYTYTASPPATDASRSESPAQDNASIRVGVSYDLPMSGGEGPTYDRLHVWRPLTLTVAGRTIRAVYFEPKEGLPAGYTTNRGLLYTSGVLSGKVVSVSIISIGLGKGAFLSALRTLVDGHTHPRVVARLQRELDASTVSAGSAVR